VGVPLFADQFENGRRIAAAGAALVVEGRRDQDRRSRALVSEQHAPGVAAAARMVLGDPAFRRSAGLIAAEMAAMPTAGEVLERLPRAGSYFSRGSG
jgi:hypothetical protein